VKENIFDPSLAWRALHVAGFIKLRAFHGPEAASFPRLVDPRLWRMFEIVARRGFGALRWLQHIDMGGQGLVTGFRLRELLRRPGPASLSWVCPISALFKT